MNISEVFTVPLLKIYFVGFVFSALSCLAIIRFAAKRTSRRNDLNAKQAMHTRHTPRIGGSGVFIGLSVILLIIAWTPWQAKHYAMYVLSVMPLFVIGFLEDIGIPMSPLRRILSICASSVITIAYWGVWVKGVGVPWLDALFSITPVAIVITVFMAAGVTNAFNLIDGLNGLAGITAVTTAFSILAIAQQTGHFYVGISSVLFISLLLGFLLFNFPRGLIFLGDGGAYLIGHTLVWLAIGLTNDEPEVSAFAILLIFFWPISDTIIAIWRRKLNRKRSVQPDRLHIHQLVLRYIEIRYLGKARRNIANPLATVLMLPLIIAPQIAGVFFATSNLMSGVAAVAFAIFFALIYRVGLWKASQMSARKRPGETAGTKSA